MRNTKNCVKFKSQLMRGKSKVSLVNGTEYCAVLQIN